MIESSLCNCDMKQGLLTPKQVSAVLQTYFDKSKESCRPCSPGVCFCFRQQTIKWLFSLCFSLLFCLRCFTLCMIWIQDHNCWTVSAELCLLTLKQMFYTKYREMISRALTPLRFPPLSVQRFERGRSRRYTYNTILRVFERKPTYTEYEVSAKFCINK